MAKILNLHIGDRLMFDGLEWTVGGVVESGAYDVRLQRRENGDVTEVILKRKFIQIQLSTEVEDDGDISETQGRTEEVS